MINKLWFDLCLYWGVVSVWPLYLKGLIGGVLQRWENLPEGKLSPKELWSSVRVTFEFLFNSLTKALLPRFLSLARRPALGRVMVVPSFLWRPLCSWGPSMLQKCFGYPSPDLCLDTILSQSFTDNSFDLMAWFLLWHALSTVGPYIDTGVPFHIMSNQLNLPQVDSNKFVETSEGWEMERWSTGAQFQVS